MDSREDCKSKPPAVVNIDVVRYFPQWVAFV
mgnify:CR=1 FL=1